MASMTIIPEDIITTHILRHLPSKSVGRFRCVSKEWLFLLTDPQFIRTHQKTLNTSRIIFESTKDGSLCSVPYNNLEAVSPLTLGLHCLHIHGSVNGLLLASAYRAPTNYIPLNGKFFVNCVLNPTTKDYLELPSYERFLGYKGFGYDSVSDDYKVVVFSKVGHGNVYVYSLRTNTMKLVISKSPYLNCRVVWPTTSGVLVNGYLHWILRSRSPSFVSKPIIVSFSLADEKLRELPPPNEVDMSNTDNKLVGLGEKLSIINDVKGDVWLMNEYGVQKSWTKIVVHGISRVKKVYDGSKVFFQFRDLLWIYDVQEQTFSEGVDISYMKVKYIAGACAESLVSPKFIRSS